MLPEILARVLDFWHPWKASPCFQGAVGEPAGLQALEEKADGGRRREEGSGASQGQTSPDTLRLLPLVLDARIFGAGPSLPGLVWKRTHGRTGRPRCPRHGDRGDRRESRRGAPHPCAKPASPFPSLLRFPNEATDLLLSIPARWRASALPRSSKQGAGSAPFSACPRLPPALRLVPLISFLQNRSRTWPGCLQRVCLPLRTPAPGVLPFLSSRIAIRRRSAGGAKAPGEGMRRRTMSQHRHFLVFHGGGGE